MMRVFRLLLVGALVLTAACSVLPTYKDDFTKKNEDFILRIRWLDFAGASLHFENEIRTEFVERFEDVDDLKVTEFSIARIDIDAPKEKVTVHYRLEYYLLPSATIKKERFPLTWEKQPGDEQGKAYWRITDPFPELD